MMMAPDAPADPLSEVEFSIPSMVCDGCAEKIREALTGIPGVRAVKPKLWRKRVHVRYEPSRVGVTQIKEALDAAGYRAVRA
jgi:copper chaperone CopZ